MAKWKCCATSVNKVLLRGKRECGSSYVYIRVFSDRARHSLASISSMDESSLADERSVATFSDMDTTADVSAIKLPKHGSVRIFVVIKQLLSRARRREEVRKAAQQPQNLRCLSALPYRQLPLLFHQLQVTSPKESWLSKGTN